MSTSETQPAPTPGELAGVAWRVSTRSDSTGGNCVEAGPFDDGSGRVAVRHSHYPHGQVIAYGQDEWDVFTAGIKAADFDF